MTSKVILEKDNKQTQEMNLLCQAVYDGLKEIVNETKENTNPNPPATSTNSELKTLMREILKNNSNNASTNLTSNKKQRRTPKRQEAAPKPIRQGKTKCTSHGGDAFRVDTGVFCDRASLLHHRHWRARRAVHS